MLCRRMPPEDRPQHYDASLRAATEQIPAHDLRSNDLSADDWNFLLRLQVQIVACWTLVKEAQLLKKSVKGCIMSARLFHTNSIVVT